MSWPVPPNRGPCVDRARIVAKLQCVSAATLDSSSPRVLITGAAGFIGTPLCAFLQQNGAHVIGVSRAVQPDGQIEWRQCDLTDSTDVRSLVDSTAPDAIVHLAGVTSAARTLDLVAPTFAANTASTVNLLSAAADRRVGRVVIAGSMEEPRATGAAASSPYAASKAAATTYARMFQQVFGLNVTTARIFMVYGPGQRDLNKLVPYVTLSLLRGQAPALSSGERLVDWVYVLDVARDLAALATSAVAAGESVDIGSGVLTSVRDVAMRLHEIIGGAVAPQFGSMPDRPLEQVAAADVVSARRVLGPASVTSLDEGLRRTVAWYREQLRIGAIAGDAR